MADRNSTWDRERSNERDDWQRDEAWRRERESGGPGERYREQEFDRPAYGRRGQSPPRGDYGPHAFNPEGGRDQELFGTGNRGYGTTWGGSGVYSEGRNLYQGEQRYMPQGPHAGKGPKGYLRSDERIREEVCDALMRHAHIDASEIEVRVKDGEVTLTGTVDRRDEKRMAEDAVETVQGVRDVHNQLRAQSNGNLQTPGIGQHNREQQMETTGNRRR
ncbi:MAG TPA: BON domain-containing protein [Candidatus Solibacter sp.]